MLEDLTLQKGLKLAVKTEQLGAEFYAKMAKRFTDNKKVADIFAQLSKDEKAHEAQFKKILDSAPPEQEGSGGYETDQYLKAVAISEFFRMEGFQKSTEIDSSAEALGTALAFEKSTLLYYQALVESLGENEQLNAVINAEKSHIISLSRILVTDAKFRGIEDKW